MTLIEDIFVLFPHKRANNPEFTYIFITSNKTSIKHKITE
jgi:hypothetical protein